MSIQLHGWQRDFFRCTDRLVVSVGGAGSGKSLVTCLKMIAYCKQYPGAFVVILRKNRESLRKSTLVMLNGLVENDDSVTHVKSDGMYKFSNGSIILYAGMKDESQRVAIRSISADMIVMEEATGFTKADFEELVARLRGTAGGFNQLILVTNPGSATHWIKTMLIDTARATVFVSKPHENPALSKEFLESLNDLSVREYRRFVLCEWVGEDESVYPDFDARVHIIEPFDIRDLDWQKWRAIGAVDWGSSVPCSFQIWLHEKETDTLYLYKEIYKANITVFDLMDDVEELLLEFFGLGAKLEWITADHAPTERQIFAELGGFTILPANKDIKTGVKLFTERLRVNAVTGKPGMMVFRNSLSHAPQKHLTENQLPYDFVTEVSAYMNMTDLNGNPTGFPKQVNDHAVDAARYLIMQVDGIKLGKKLVTRQLIEERRKIVSKRGDWLSQARNRRFGETRNV